MKTKLFAALAALAILLTSCGGIGTGTRLITTTSQGLYSRVDTDYWFKDDALITVTQTLTYNNTEVLEEDFESISKKDDYFIWVTKDGNKISYTLTEKCLSELYPDATYDSVLAEAQNSGLTIETHE